MAFALLAVGYASLGVFTTLGPVLVGLTLIILGGAIVKPVISGGGGSIRMLALAWLLLFGSST